MSRSTNSNYKHHTSAIKHINKDPCRLSSPCISQNNVWYILLACLYREELHGIHCLRERRYLICFLLNHVLYLQNLQHRPLFALSIRFKKSQQITFISSTVHVCKEHLFFPCNNATLSVKRIGKISRITKATIITVIYILMKNVKNFTSLIFFMVYLFRPWHMMPPTECCKIALVTTLH